MVNSRYLRGFTLIEVLMVVALVAILASIALPNYMEYLRKGNRADVQQWMYQEATKLERIYSRNGGYPDTFSIVQKSDYYTLRYVPLSKPDGALGTHRNLEFELRATPKADSSQASDVCGVLTLDEQSTESSQGQNNDCW
ncbi:prepilin-type N-terminal cleavage/methylation domain-containing protein [Pseudoalteromonas sp. SMS1]|uniref:type IV pilin protein n=1 Tax=Pseudoalteromonas sp. SMS1 TaxID=2908894 RepID=UPI001F2BC8C7|nr:type IV pilin protein [Pseudoalteromonas sp. SMS1]MCF2859671.1 prepilin-type N-terminal cleavage/methylation domain-containing protein [Pseudoalteromonas sp. SMS1]